MTLHKRTREQMLAHCGEIHEDDGVDPRDYFKPPRNERQQNRKALQLCRQVAQTLDQVFAGELGDAGLSDLRVAAVRPAPDASRLLVSVWNDAPHEPFHRELLASRLRRISGRLRTEVAAAVTRRRAPILEFEVLAEADPPLGGAA